TSMAAHTTMVSHVLRRRHHGRRSVSVSSTISTHRVSTGARTHGWEGAAEAGSSALEVREAAGWAGPVSRARSILARREGSQDLSSAIKDAAGRRGDLDCFLVERTAVHAQALGSLEWC